MMKNIFDVLKNITATKNENDLGTDLYNPYMINRFLSMQANYVRYAMLTNRYWDIPKEYQEILLFHIIPKRSVFFKYIKASSNKKDFTERKKDIMNKYKCSDKKAEELIEFYNRIQDKKNGL